MWLNPTQSEVSPLPKGKLREMALSGKINNTISVDFSGDKSKGFWSCHQFGGIARQDLSISYFYNIKTAIVGYILFTDLKPCDRV